MIFRSTSEQQFDSTTPDARSSFRRRSAPVSCHGTRHYVLHSSLAPARRSHIPMAGARRPAAGRAHERFGVKPRASGPSSPGHCRIAGAGDGDLAYGSAQANMPSLQSRARNPRRKRPGAYADQNPRCWLCLLVPCEHSSPLHSRLYSSSRRLAVHTRTCIAMAHGFNGLLVIWHRFWLSS